MLKAVLKTFSWFLNLFPRPIILFLGKVIGWFGYDILRFRRRIVWENLQLAFPEKSETEIAAIARKNYEHYGTAILDVVRGLNWTKEKCLSESTVEGLENFDEFLKSNRGGILLSLHLGCWENAVNSIPNFGVPFDLVIKKARTPWMEDLLQWYRTKHGVHLFWETKTASEIQKSISSGRFVGFVLDQFMGPPIGLPVTFFGKLAGTTVSLALLAEKRDFPIIPTYTYREADGRHHYVFLPPVKVDLDGVESREERLYRRTQTYNNLLETIVRKHPEQWLWLHRRWKSYVGQPRWLVKGLQFAATALLMGVISCVSTPEIDRPTIVVPPDKPIEIPDFESSDNGVEQKEVVVEVAPKAKKTEKPAPPKPRLESYAKYKIPFQVGERHEIGLSWMGLSAGTATMEVRKGEPVKGRETFLLWGNALSSKLVDAIYHVDNTAESTVDAKGLVPYKFLLHMIESHQTKETKVTFDHKKQKAHYWAKRISQKWGNQDADRDDDIVLGARDLYSALYFARVLDYKLDKKQHFTVYENNQLISVELLPIGNELVKTSAGAFQCWKLAVTVKINNVLKPMDNTYLWLSDDSKKYIVKFEAKLKVGALKGELAVLKDNKL